MIFLQKTHFLGNSLTKHPKVFYIWDNTLAGVVKLVDAPDSKSGTRESVRVRFPPPA